MNRVVSYTAGLVLALVLTLAAFGLVFAHVNGVPGALVSPLLVGVVLVLAMIQLAVQLIFFLHLGLSKGARWNSVMFVITFSGIAVIVIASIWIMAHLNYNMTPEQMRQYINGQSGL